MFLLLLLFYFLKIIERKQSPQLKSNLYYITLKLDYIDRTQSKAQRLDHTKTVILLDNDITKRIELR